MQLKINELLRQVLEDKGGQLNHHLFVWASDGLLYKKLKAIDDFFEQRNVLKFRLFNEDEEYYGFTRQGKACLRHAEDDDNSTQFLEKKVKIKGHIAQMMDAPKTKELMLISRDYFQYKANGEAYYCDSRMVAIQAQKLDEL